MEKTILGVLSDLLLVIDSGDTAALILQDLSAAFDTVNQPFDAPVNVL
jgi:hypothetical protein